jgi:hypothetical protein
VRLPGSLLAEGKGETGIGGQVLAREALPAAKGEVGRTDGAGTSEFHGSDGTRVVGRWYDGGSTVVLRWNSLPEHGRVRLGLGHGGGRNGLGCMATDDASDFDS